MSDNEIKIADLARIWNVSVNTVWKRIEKEQLLTIKKLDNNREVTFVSISEAVLNKYIDNNINNGVNNQVINGNYEEMLTDNNINNYSNTVDNNINNPKTTEIIEKIMSYSKDVNEQLLDINNSYNEQIKSLNEELITVKSKQLLLEDKASREGSYLNEINELKAVNNKLITDNERQVKRLNQIISILKYSLIVIITLILISLTALITVNYLTNDDVKEQVKTETVEEKGL